MGMSLQFNGFLFNMSFPIDGSTSENVYGKGELNDNLSGYSLNVGYEFKLLDVFMFTHWSGFQPGLINIPICIMTKLLLESHGLIFYMKR